MLHEDGDRQVWRHLERHERGRVFHGLYLRTPDRLGKLFADTARIFVKRAAPGGKWRIR
ncbi:hypothetical protein ACTMTI_40720 [Nonomuraea sp. H19]|uniref:hypothetical protein n=1 Tax=Nonomuraea sp. H19 TaxID=3452206 RepID=UPI003F899B7E